MESHSQRIQQYIDEQFEKVVLPSFLEFLRIPNLSPDFDKEWESNGNIDNVVKLIIEWAESLGIKNLSYQILKEPKRSPIIIFQIEGQAPGKIMYYGHIDKQPPMTQGWSEGLHPYQPKIVDNKLYARGASDDGWAVFSSLLSIKACQELGISHSKTVIVLESGEESGSTDFIYFLPKIKEIVQDVNIIGILDCFTQTYETIWLTDSLRGVINFELSVNITKSSAHSGDAGGIIPSTWRILTLLLERLYDPASGKLKLNECYVNIPQEVLENAQKVGALMGSKIYEHFQFMTGAKPENEDAAELILNNTFRPCLEITGIDGLPKCEEAGNVLRSSTKAKVSIRVPPGTNVQEIIEKIKSLLLNDVPQNAKVEISKFHICEGFYVKPLPQELKQSAQEICLDIFGQQILNRGTGGSIGIVKPLNQLFPQANLLMLGVLGPASNAHCPNECLDIPYFRNYTNFLVQFMGKFAKYSLK